MPSSPRGFALSALIDPQADGVWSARFARSSERRGSLCPQRVESIHTNTYNQRGSRTVASQSSWHHDDSASVPAARAVARSNRSRGNRRCTGTASATERFRGIADCALAAESYRIGVADRLAVSCGRLGSFPAGFPERARADADHHHRQGRRVLSSSRCGCGNRHGQPDCGDAARLAGNAVGLGAIAPCSSGDCHRATRPAAGESSSAAQAGG